MSSLQREQLLSVFQTKQISDLFTRSTKWKMPDRTKIFKCIFAAGIIFKSCCTFLFYFLRESLWKSTVPTLYVTELVVQLNCTHLLYLPRNSWSSLTVPIFCIVRRNHSQIVQYLCSLYLQESLLICTVTSLFAVKFTVKSKPLGTFLIYWQQES